MKKVKIPAPTCLSCDAYNTKLLYNRCCEGGKRPRYFKSRDPKRKIPVWCPRYKKPAVMRIYGFINTAAELLIYTFEDISNKLNYAYPSTGRYKLEFVGAINMTAREFYQAVCEEPHRRFIDYDIRSGYVIEIDDGIKPYFFYYSKNGKFVPARFTPPESNSGKRTETR